MTPDEEARFIQLWQEGASYKAIAQAMGCALGTVASRSAALAAQGKITPRGVLSVNEQKM
jgi:DNA-directed RNA polymerase specialized sigma24 family protein